MELLIATVILASAGALLAGGLLWANRSAETRRQRAQLTQLLASQLNLLPEAVTGQEPGQGSFDPPIDDAAWTLQIEPIQGTIPPLQRLTLTVTQQGQSAAAVTDRPLAEPTHES